MRIEPATILEWPQIQALRKAFFEQFDAPVSRIGREECHWYVALEGERVVGCFSMREVPEYRQLWVMDLYRTDDPAGARAIVRMTAWLDTEAERSGLPLTYTVEPRNTAWIEALLAHGAEPIAIVFQGGGPRSRRRLQLS